MPIFADPTVVRLATTANPATVAAATTSTAILAANNNRKGATIWNNSNGVLFLEFGATAAVATAAVRLPANSVYEVPFDYVGQIAGIWNSNNGNAQVREFT
jgi:hypothetical protein